MYSRLSPASGRFSSPRRIRPCGSRWRTSRRRSGAAPASGAARTSPARAPAGAPAAWAASWPVLPGFAAERGSPIVITRARRMIVRALAGDRVVSSDGKVASTSTLSPGRSLPATPVSALISTEISRSPGASAGCSMSIPCWSSTPACSGVPGTRPAISAGSRSDALLAYFSGTVFLRTASSGIGCSSGTLRDRHEHGRLGVEVLAHPADVVRDRAEHEDRAERGDHEQQHAASLSGRQAIISWRPMARSRSCPHRAHGRAAWGSPHQGQVVDGVASRRRAMRSASVG